MKNTSNLSNKKGFTLIELLVVIAIIGILSGIGLVSLNGAREKARDAQRVSDLAQFRTALVLYFDSNAQKYPPGNIGFDGIADCVEANGRRFVDGAGVMADISTTFPSNVFFSGYTNGGVGTVIPTFLAAQVLPPVKSAPTATPLTGEYTYCYDTNGDAPGETLNAFLVYSKLESGAKTWYWLDQRGAKGTPAANAPHANSACIHNGTTNPCAW